jgi:hypothetical protein
MSNVDQKTCYGILDKVFPMGDEGLREIVPRCFDCPEKRECLQAALETEQGIAMRRALLERTPPQGLMGRLKRWSERKALSREMEHRKGPKR